MLTGCENSSVPKHCLRALGVCLVRTKTLTECPASVVLTERVCSSAEMRLLFVVRSQCVRIRVVRSTVLGSSYRCPIVLDVVVVRRLLVRKSDDTSSRMTQSSQWCAPIEWRVVVRSGDVHCSRPMASSSVAVLFVAYSGRLRSWQKGRK